MSRTSSPHPRQRTSDRNTLENGCLDPHPPRQEIHCCDACQKLENDEAALEAVVKAAETQPVLLKFVEEIARLKYEREPSDDEVPFEPTSEDSIATLNQLILQAGQLLGS